MNISVHTKSTVCNVDKYICITLYSKMLALTIQGGRMFFVQHLGSSSASLIHSSRFCVGPTVYNAYSAIYLSLASLAFYLFRTFSILFYLCATQRLCCNS